MTILLIDTFSAFFRAFYALPPMNTQSGEPTSALYGFSVLLLKLARENRGSSLAFGVDAPTRTFRHAAYPAYKAGRPETPSPLSAQLRRLPRLLDAFGVPVLRAPGFEADDVLATLAARARAIEAPTLVVSGDRDLLQLAHGGVRVHFIGARGMAAVTYDEALVIERFGVPPTGLPSYVALVGDPSDNLPSVPGIGAVTARKLCGTFGSMPELFRRLAEVTPERLRSTLAEHETQILQNEELARLRVDVPLPDGAEPWKRPAPADWRRLRQEFEALEFKSLLPRVDALIASAESDPAG